MALKVPRSKNTVRHLMAGQGGCNDPLHEAVYTKLDDIIRRKISGIVYDQNPKPGEVVPVRARCSIYCNRKSYSLTMD